ncbi:MAG: peptidylprolyl isomerase [Clostridia bacterium]|nr:peptidylprolyl isomerase [Clostridia bacterium]
MAKKKNSNYVTEKTKQRNLDKEKAKKARKVKKILEPVLIGLGAVLLCVALGFGIYGIVLLATADNPDLTVTHHASIEIEGHGTLHVELYGNEAPITVANFVKLAESGFYDDTVFHRIIDGFMAQGGGYDKNGTPKKADTIKGEFEINGVKNRIKHTEGVISMARVGGAPNSASSEFFIVDETSENNSLSLDGQYAAFGKVTDGMDIIKKICDEIENNDNNGGVAKENRPVIKSITIHEAH